MTFFSLTAITAALILQAAPVLSPADRPPATAPLQTGSADSSYLLGVGDKVRIVVFEEASLSGTFSVSSNGDIAFPLVGPVKAVGLSPEQLEGVIGRLLNDGYIKDARVNVEVMTYRPYYILGEVTKPGEYAYSSALTVMKAVAAAGGFTYRANQKRVFIKSLNDKDEHLEPLSPSTPISPGDTVRITERYF